MKPGCWATGLVLGALLGALGCFTPSEPSCEGCGPNEQCAEGSGCACAPGFLDCDGEAANGCESAGTACGSCIPESDAAFCVRLGKDCGIVAADNNCGERNTADCGACLEPETCGGAGVESVCGRCIPENDEAFCARLGKDCGLVVAENNCGDPNTAHCGECREPQSCGWGGLANVCGGGAEHCGDAVDNDGDGMADCADVDCAADTVYCGGGVELCGDALDNDGDGRIDCADVDCATDTVHCGGGLELCGDGVDNDGDGMIDCVDVDCADDAVYCGAAEHCGDAIDNDGDGAADCDDPDCAADTVHCGGGFESDCTNGLDDDADGVADCDDQDCAVSPTCLVDCSECQEVFCMLLGCGSGCACGLDGKQETACEDAADNDGDGLIDCIDDDCAGQSPCA